MLKVHVKNLGTTAVLYLQGRIVTGETEILREVVQSVSETRAVVLDLAQVTTVDAHGLGVMLELREQAEANGIHFELMNVTAQVARVLRIARLDSVFSTSPVVDFLPAFQRSRRAPAATLASCA